MTASRNTSRRIRATLARLMNVAGKNTAPAAGASAREDFIEARDLGFQPSYLEGITPAEYLQRMDEKDAADRQASVAASGSANVPAQTVALADETTAAPAGGSASDQQQLQHQAEVDRLAEQQRIYKAQGLVDTAKKEESEGNDQEALDQYTQAVDLDPTNKQAVQGRDRLLAKMGRAPANGGATLTRTQQQIAQVIAAINYKFSTAVDQAQKDTAADQFAAAENDIQNAQAARDEDPTVFNADDLRRMDTRIQEAKLDLQRTKDTYDRREAAMRASNVAGEESRAEQEDRRRRDVAVTAYIKLSRAQIEQQNYAAALGVLDQILAIDPQNDYALGIRQFVEDKAILQEQRHYREEFDYNLARIPQPRGRSADSLRGYLPIPRKLAGHFHVARQRVEEQQRQQGRSDGAGAARSSAADRERFRTCRWRTRSISWAISPAPTSW